MRCVRSAVFVGFVGWVLAGLFQWLVLFCCWLSWLILCVGVGVFTLYRKMEKNRSGSSGIVVEF